MNKTKKSLVPMLRFPEFKDAGEWKFLNGDKVFEAVSNKNHQSELPILAITQDHGAIPRELIDYNVVVSKKSVEGYKVVEVGDFIISLRSFQGGIELSNFEGICSPAYIILRRKIEGVNNFYKHYFKSQKFIQELNKNIEGIRDGKMVSYKQFSDIMLPVISSDEQQKIADCLDSLDNLITSQHQKLAELQAHKYGLIQQLFPLTGEVMPSVRFPSFENRKAWKLVNGNELFETVSDKKHKSDLPILAISQEHGAVPRDEIEYNVIVTDKSVASYKVVDVGDFIISLRSFQGGIEYSNYKGICSPAYIILRRKKEIVDDFFRHFFKTKMFIYELNKNIEGIRDGKMVSYKQFSDLFLPVPSIEEQQQIANCLSSLEKLIIAHRQKLEAFSLLKSGLVQQLFHFV